MKKFICLLFFVLLSVGAYAQSKQFGIGAQLDLASENNLLGIGGHFNYRITNPFRVQFSGDYYFSHNDVKMADLNLDAHYIFSIGRISFYPLAGLTLVFVSGVGDETKFGGNIGGGFEIPLVNNLSVGAELKGQLVEDYSRFNSAFKVTYHF